jgi:tRNA threonylcarbamoyl adenosine modification protein YeaZ
VTSGLVLAFDTATDVATSALLADGVVLGERASAARTLLDDIDSLLRDAHAQPEDLDALVVGTGPGSFTSTRIGLAVARGLGLGLGIPAAGVSTLDALASARAGAYPVIDARRREVFVPGPRAVLPDDLDLEPGSLCVGSGAVRYRATLERMGAIVPPDDDEVHVPHARLHASLAREAGDPDALEPIYVRAPDAKAGAA